MTDTRAIKPEDNKGGTFTQELDSAEVTTAYVSPVPDQAPGVITAEPGTGLEEAIYYRTTNPGAGTIGGLIRDYTNLNGGVGQTHQNREDWEVFQSAFYIQNLVDIVLEGFFYEQAVIARVSDTTFTVVGNKAIFYTAGRLLRCNEDNNEILPVVNSSYNAGTGLTTVTVDGTLPNPLTDIEIGIQPKTAGYLSLGATIVDTNGNEVIKIPATTDAVNEITVTNSATGNAPQVSATGDDTNIDLKLGVKGTGDVDLVGNANANIKVGGSDPYRTIVIPAGSMSPTTTAGCAAVATVEAGTNDVDYKVLDFDTASDESAWTIFQMPNNWDGGTITFKPVWTAASGSGTVCFGLKGRAYADDDAIDQAYGTEQTSTDTLITAGDVHIGPESSAITLAGTPAGGQLVQLKITRQTGSDTLGVDARLIGIRILYRIATYSD